MYKTSIQMLNLSMVFDVDVGIESPVYFRSICFFENGKIKDVIEMPTMTDGRTKRQVNGAQIFNEIRKIKKLIRKI